MFCLELVPTAKGQELLCDGIGLLPRSPDLAETLSDLLGKVLSEHQQFRVAIDGHQ